MITLRLLSVTILVLLFLHIGCKHSTAPPPPPPTEPDTTSHDFTWQMETISGTDPSVVRDVAIINDTCIWAVGEIYPPEYSDAPYSGAVWDGKHWTAIQVPYHDYGTTQLRSGMLFSIWAFSATSIYVVSGANLLKWDGHSWTEKAFFMTTIPWYGTVTKMWAENESNIYLVGRTGSIYHYTGSSWTKMVSGTTVDLLDVWGDVSKGVIWAAGSTPTGFHSVLLKYQNGQWRTIWARDGTTGVPPFDRAVGSVWTASSTYLSACGVWTSSVFRMGADTTSLKLLASSSAFTNCLRGNGDNDIIGVGEQGIIWHYNGSTYKELQQGTYQFRLRSCDIKGNMIVAVGEDYSAFLSRALFYVGRRQ